MANPHNAQKLHPSLSPELAEFARSDSEAHAFDSMGECMRGLIRRRRQEQIKRDVACLEEAITGAPAGEERAAIVKSQHRIRAERKRAGRV